MYAHSKNPSQVSYITGQTIGPQINYLNSHITIDGKKGSMPAPDQANV